MVDLKEMIKKVNQALNLSCTFFLVVINRTFIYIWEHASLHHTVGKTKQKLSHAHIRPNLHNQNLQTRLKTLM